MKFWISVVVMLVAAAGLAACGGGSNEEGKSEYPGRNGSEPRWPSASEPARRTSPRRRR